MTADKVPLTLHRRCMMKIVSTPTVFQIMMWIIIILDVEGDVQNKLHRYEVLRLDDILLVGQKDIRLSILDSYHFMQFKAFQRNFDIELRKSSVVTPSLETVIVDRKGSERKSLLQHTHYYTGTLTDDPRSSCTVSVDPGGILAHISTGGEEFIIEPAWRHSHVYLNSTDMMVYRKSDVKNQSNNHTIECEESHHLRHENYSKMKHHLIDNVSSYRFRRSLGLGNRNVCRILLVADHYFHNGIGGGSIPSTQNYMINMISQVDEIFKTTRWDKETTGLGLEISRLIVHESSSDNGFNMKNRQMPMETLLYDFGRAYYSQNSQYCLMHLLTFTAFDGKLGLAFVASSRPFDWGGMCSNADTWKKEALNTGVSTFMDPQGNRQLAVVSMSTVAHEIGHNWGSNHDPDTDDCSPSSSSGGQYLMFSKALKGVANNNLKFSPCSRRAIYSVLLAKGSKCLTEPREGIGLCGNGRIDVGEACDPGTFSDGCCSRSCQLAANAVCSPVNYACCTNNCQLANNNTECHLALTDDSSCLGISHCNGVDFICPNPPPKSNVSCIDGGTCQNGVCVGFCKVRGQLPCICSDQSGNSCKQCCKASENSECAPYPGAPLLTDGQICVHGFCKKGVCVKSSLPEERLWKVILQQITNSFEIFMRDNIVLFVTLFSLVVYIPAAILVYRHDKREDEADDVVRKKMRKKRNDVRLDLSGRVKKADIIREVLNPISVADLRRRRISKPPQHLSSMEFTRPSHHSPLSGQPSQPYDRTLDPQSVIFLPYDYSNIPESSL